MEPSLEESASRNEKIMYITAAAVTSDFSKKFLFDLRLAFAPFRDATGSPIASFPLENRVSIFSMLSNNGPRLPS